MRMVFLKGRKSIEGFQLNFTPSVIDHHAMHSTKTFVEKNKFYNTIALFDIMQYTVQIRFLEIHILPRDSTF